jgi:hypothetical protein
MMSERHPTLDLSGVGLSITLVMCHLWLGLTLYTILKDGGRPPRAGEVERRLDISFL